MSDWSFCLPAILIGLIPAAIAHSKGKDFFTWWLFGAALFIVALPAAFLIKPDNEELEYRQLQQGDLIKCPHCAELIKKKAKICKHCGRDLIKSSVNETDLRLEVVKELSEFEDFSHIQFCPKCDIPMKRAKATKGPFQGKDFYVCPNYKQCNQYWDIDRPEAFR